MSWAVPVTVVGLDADDTLWHNEDDFAKAQGGLRELLAPHAEPQLVMRRLDEIERANLEVYGYGVKGFTLSMIETALELSDGAVPGSQLRELLEVGKRMLLRPVELIDGVADTVERLHRSRRLVMVTKGDLFAQESRIARSGLADAFEAVEIVSQKDEATYSRVLRRLGVPPREFLMVGNSEVSDVLPVLALGGWAAHVPYAVTASFEVPSTPPPPHARRADLASLTELPDLLGI